MIRNIRRIGNSKGIIIPQYILQEIGSPTAVDITTTKKGILITPIAGKTVRRKPRNRDETRGLYELMKSKIESNLDAGKTRWIGDREMERRL